MEKGLVSIVTPCYNGEEYLDRYFSSILNQTYKNIELFFIDDGSTDKTKLIAEKYKKEFEKQNTKFVYIYQKNAGQASAINQGLPLVNGEFLVWPDSDDFYEKSALEKMADYLNNNQDKDYVRCKVNIRNEDDIQNIAEVLGPKDKSKTDLFEDYIFENDIYCFPGVIMTRMEWFDKVKKERHIYESRAGQNWQLILPIAYQGVAGFVDEPLYNYVVRQNSHSRQKTRTSEEEFKKWDGLKQTLEHVLSEMNLYEQYATRLEDKYNIKKMLVSFSYREREKAKYYADLIINKKDLKMIEKIIIMIANNAVLFSLFKFFKK